MKGHGGERTRARGGVGGRKGRLQSREGRGREMVSFQVMLKILLNSIWGEWKEFEVLFARSCGLLKNMSYGKLILRKILRCSSLDMSWQTSSHILFVVIDAIDSFLY